MRRTEQEPKAVRLTAILVVAEESLGPGPLPVGPAASLAARLDLWLLWCWVEEGIGVLTHTGGAGGVVSARGGHWRGRGDGPVHFRAWPHERPYSHGDTLQRSMCVSEASPETQNQEDTWIHILLRERETDTQRDRHGDRQTDTER